MLIYITVTRMQAETIDNAGMALGIIHDHIVAAAKRIDSAHHTLIAIVKEHCIFLSYEFSQLMFKLLMVCRVPAHHAGAHWGSQSILCSCLCVSLANFRMISQAQVIVQAPYD